MLNGGMHHAIDLDVDRIDGLPCRLCIDIEPFHRLADPAELGLVFQLDTLGSRNRQGGGVSRDLAIGETALRGSVNDLAGLRRQFRRGNPEAIGCGGEEHRAGKRAEPAHRVVARSNRHAAAGNADLAEHDLIIRSGRRIFNNEPRRVHVEFLADNLRHRREDALPALDEGTHETDGIVGPDFEEGRNARPGCHGGRGFRRAGFADRNAEPEHKGPSGCANRAKQQAAPREIYGCAGRQRLGSSEANGVFGHPIAPQALARS
jgi:hypothetical protein